MTAVVMSTSTCSRSEPSRTSTAKTIEARPRGPNQAVKATLGGLRTRPEQREPHGNHPDQGQAQHGIENDPPVGGTESRAERDRSEHDERDPASTSPVASVR